VSAAVAVASLALDTIAAVAAAAAEGLQRNMCVGARRCTEQLRGGSSVCGAIGCVSTTSNSTSSHIVRVAGRRSIGRSGCGRGRRRRWRQIHVVKFIRSSSVCREVFL